MHSSSQNSSIKGRFAERDLDPLRIMFTRSRCASAASSWLCTSSSLRRLAMQGSIPQFEGMVFKTLKQFTLTLGQHTIVFSHLQLTSGERHTSKTHTTNTSPPPALLSRETRGTKGRRGKLKVCTGGGSHNTGRVPGTACTHSRIRASFVCLGRFFSRDIAASSRVFLDKPFHLEFFSFMLVCVAVSAACMNYKS